MAIEISPEQWADVARAAKEALALMGYPVFDCLPDEPGAAACGGDYHEHAMAYLVALQEVAGHQLLHLGPPTVHVDAVRQDVRAKLEQHPRCQR